MQSKSFVKRTGICITNVVHLKNIVGNIIKLQDNWMMDTNNTYLA